MKNLEFKTFLKNCSKSFTSAINPSLSKTDYFPIDLSAANNSLKSIDFNSSITVEQYITEYLKQNNSKVAYGGYLEQRAIYQRSAHFNQHDPETERNIHLGIDLWIGAGTEVLAILDGKIHSFHDNTNFGDYGPTIILKHTIEGLEFYSLYGHLSRKSIEGIQSGQKFKKGEVIGKLGYPEENGDYAPHLHLQLIKNIGGFKGDYPGVCAKKDLDYYMKNCPDPNLLLKIN